jgi:hypothetical protein
VTQFVTLIVMNLVTPKAAARHQLLFNKPASGAHTSGVFFSVGRHQA